MVKPHETLGAGPASPSNDDGPTVASGGPSGGQGKADDANCAAREHVEQADQTFAALRARLALAGFELHIATDAGGRGVFVIGRWNLTRELHDLAAVEAFAAAVGAIHA